VTEIVDEIIVVDGFSADSTIEIAKRHGAKVFSRKPSGFVEPDRTFALRQANYDWILYLDTDERLGAKLKANLRYLLEYADRNGIDAYSTLRVDLTSRNVPILGPFYTDQTRIYRKSRVLYRGILHERPQVFGHVRRLAEDFYILHMPDYSMKKFVQYAYFEAMSLDAHTRGSLIESALWALAPLSTLAIYAYYVVHSARSKLLNVETLLYTFRFAAYKSIVHTLMKTGTRRKRAASVVDTS